MRLRTEDLSWQRLDEDIVVLDLQGSSYLKLNATGSVLWEALLEGSHEQALVGLLVERYGVEEDVAARDVETFLADLRTAGLLEE